MTWTQVYDPLHNWILSTLVAALPILVLFGLLAGLRVKPHWCAIAGAATAVVVAVTVFGMPFRLAGMSFVYGVGFGVVKIAWIVLAAVYLYDVSVHTGQFEIMKESVAGITADRRLQLLMVAFCFGAFIEGAAGFGAPVAIAGAFMIGLGFKPFHAAALNLLANTSPVAWGAIGTPVHTLAAVSGLPESDLSAMIGRILPITGIIVPFWLVRAMVSWSETFEVLPAILVVGVSFSVTQYFWSNHVDSNLVDIAGGVISLFVTVIFLRFWQPKRIWRLEHERAAPAAALGLRRHTAGQIVKAWMPFAILSVFVLVWGLPTVKGAMNRATTPVWDVPFLHLAVTRAALVAGLLLGVGPVQLAKIFWYTLKRMKLAVIAISFMLGLGFTTRYSGLDAVLGLAFTRSGWFYPFFGTFLGWLGVALTGSDTSSNALFGSLQRITSQQLGLDPVLMCAANSAGGVMGKMVDAQSITVATSATNQVGNEGSIFRYVFWHSVALGAVVGAIVLLYAYVFPGGVPHGLTIVK